MEKTATRTSHRAPLAAVLIMVATLLVWVLAPMDLLPRWAAIGTPKAGVLMTVDPAEMTSDVIVNGSDYLPDGFLGELVGLRVDDARRRVDARTGPATLVVATRNLIPTSGDSAFVPDRISVDVILGRVVRAQTRG